MIELPDDIRMFITKISKINKKYSCKKYGKITNIIEYVYGLIEILLAIKCHNESIAFWWDLDAHFEMISNFIELNDIKEDSNNNKNDYSSF